MLEGAAFQAEQAARVATMQAWLTAGFERQKRLPKLSKVLEGVGKKAARRPQTVAEQAALIREMHARLGGTLTTGAPTNG